MSQFALCQAVKQILQAELDVDDAVCDIGFDGEPNPSCGQEFIRVHPGRWGPMPAEGLYETFGVSVTLTHRIPSAPKDRPPWPDFEARLRQILAVMHLDVNADAILNAANVIIGALASGFVTPPKFADGGTPTPKGPDWFSASTVQESQKMNAGIAQTLRFENAERLQTIESMA